MYLLSIMFRALVTLSATLWNIGWLSVEPSDNADVDGESTVLHRLFALHVLIVMADKSMLNVIVFRPLSF